MGTRRSSCLRLVLLTALILPGALRAEETTTGEVKLPLDEYKALQARASEPRKPEIPPPVAVTLSRAAISVEIPEEPGAPAAITAEVNVHVLRAQWTAVPLLPAGTSLTRATANGKVIALSPIAGDLVWSTKDQGTHTLALEYTAPVVETAGGRSVPLPVPPAAAIELEASLPGEGLRISVLPASGFTVEESGGTTMLQATVRTTRGVQIAWEVPTEQRALVGRGSYSGTLRGAVVAWTAEIEVRVLTADPVVLPLLADSVALASARVDGKPATVEEQEQKLAVHVRGVGRHRISLEFETAVREEGGPTATDLWLPRLPVSAFTLSLPGKKKVEASPEAGVDTRRQGNRTVASLHLPPADRVTFSWSEALPEAAHEKLRANAEIFHVARAEEGVLQVQAILAYQVTRGASNVLTAKLPSTVVVNRVTGDGVKDWRAARAKGGAQVLTVYLDREIKGEYRARVDYELLLGAGGEAKTPVTLPLLTPQDVHRHRGMVALLSGAELEMHPEQARAMNKVGENQLPAWVRKGITATVGHTYKYVEPGASLNVTLAPPERRRGQFDAAIDTLFSVGDGVLKASASIAIAVKNGKLMDLDLALPEGINLIDVTAPSLREHKLLPDEGRAGDLLRLNFTQELEGTLRIEVGYERVLAGGLERVAVPALHVPGADMEQGRLAVEALTAVEVQAAEAELLLPLDVRELPRQLTLRTTNPILLAYKYVHAEPPFTLALEVKHHAEMKVQVAAIDRARYQTLYTRHGLALTRASYQVRNRRKQFLKVSLPEESELWSAQLAGQPVKPARNEDPSSVLVPLLNSAAPFQVEIVYATAVPSLGVAGWLDGRLPVPDIVETESTWDVFLPEALRYGQVDSNMVLSEKGVAAQQIALDSADELARAADGHAGLESAHTEGGTGVLPLRIEVPKKGVHYRFEKLFANRGEEEARFSLHYTTAGARTGGGFLLALMVMVLGAVIAGRAGVAPSLDRRKATGLAAAAGAVLLLAVLLLGAGWGWAVGGGVLLVAALFSRWWIRRRGTR